MPAGILIYCERTGAWAAAMRREESIFALAQRQTRSIAECRETLIEFPASLVVLELTAVNLEKGLQWLAQLPQEFPCARSTVVAERGLEPHEWIAREFGSLAFTTSPRELAPLAKLIRRYFASLPGPQLTWKEQIWAQLPGALKQPAISRTAP
jgi:hypothetical protein